MLTAAGTVAADPRNPAVAGQLNKWKGEIEAMAAIEAGIDPGAAVCDKVVQSVLGGVAGSLEKLAPTAPAVPSSNAPASLALHCESLPDIFGKMMNEVTSRIPENLDQQCKVSWIPDSYFAGKSAISGADAPKPPGNANAQRAALANARERCVALFTPPLPTVGKHGLLLNTLITELDSVIYREGRQAPTK
jgi:hypothetical protein